MRILRTLLCCAALAVLCPGASAQELSKYREFSLGMSLEQLAGRIGQRPAEAATLLARPVLIQEVNWRPPQPTRSAPQTESAEKIVFTFYNGELFQIAVYYDRDQTKGLTMDDLRQAISLRLGHAPAIQRQSDQPARRDEEAPVAQWETAEFRHELFYSMWSDYRLVISARMREMQAGVATTLGALMTQSEAPQREAARLKGEADELVRAREKNKKSFRP